MTRLRTCRLCHAQDAGPMHRYAIRHYAHHDCYLRLRFLDLYARRWWLSPLSRWPLKQFPVDALRDNHCLDYAWELLEGER